MSSLAKFILKGFTLEHGRKAYLTDLWFYAITSIIWLIWLIVSASTWPVIRQIGSFGSYFLGLISWTLLEYVIHRFVLHKVQPFEGWHQAHHQRPTAFITSPTAVTVLVFLVLVAWPAYIWTPIWFGLSYSGGIFTGSAIYSWVHHFVHQRRLKNSWLMDRKIWHALHHRPQKQLCFGVTTSLWDRVFKTDWNLQPQEKKSKFTPKRRAR